MRVRYYPSFPFGELHLQNLKQKLSDFSFCENEELSDVALLDSNAIQSLSEIKEDRVLLINPIINPQKEELKKPLYLRSRFLSNAFIRRSRRYQLEPFLQSYSYPNDWDKGYWQACKDLLKQDGVWKELLNAKYETKDQSALLRKKRIMILSNPEDPLRSNERLEWEQEFISDLPHGLLAFSQANWDLVRKMIQDLSR